MESLASQTKLKGQKCEMYYSITTVFVNFRMSTLPNNGLQVATEDSDFLLGNLNGIFNSSVTNDTFLDTVWLR